MFKKSWLSLVLVFILCFSLFAVGCGGGGKKSNKNGETFALAESLVPGAPSFPKGTDDSVQCLTVNYSYYMAKHEVTYKLWKEVYDWANLNGYTFCNPGNPGGGWDDTSQGNIYFDTGHETHPVTNINRYDVYAWCNALTEYYNAKNGKNLDSAYKDEAGNIIKDATDEDIQGYIKNNTNDFDRSAKGFRLPTGMEWELAARYIDGSKWTPGNYASGATADCTNSEAIGAVAWYRDNSKISSNVYSTQPVGQKKPNALGIYDMTGNVGELCFGTPENYFSFKIYRGGCFDDNNSSVNLQIGYENGDAPDYAGPNIGFRTMRTE